MKLRSQLLIGVLLLLTTGLVYAAGTQEVYSDAGFQPGMFLNFFPNPNNSSSVSEPSDGQTLEGVKYFVTTAPHGNGNNWAAWAMQFSPNGTFQDYSAYAGGSLRFLLKTNFLVHIKIEYDNGSGSKIQPSVDIPGTGGAWTEQVIPLSNFSGLNLSRITAPFIIAIDADPSVDRLAYLDHVRWTKPLQTLAMFPGTTSAAIGNHRQLIAEGRSSGGEFVDVYPTWSVTGAGNSVSPGVTAGSRYTILTMGAPGGTVNALADGIGGSAAVTVAGSAPDPFGLVSETIPGLTLGTDASIQPLGSVTIADDSTGGNFVEGTKSTSAQVNGFGGWYVQWGLTGDPDTNIKDMSVFYDGSIRFWFKAPSTLQSLMQVGIRSGNVPGGQELSKVALAASLCDNTWHQVVIPLAQFAKAAPWADLARTKVFFEIFSTGPGSATFWVDNLRWDPTAPGPLASIVVNPPSPVAVPLGGNRNFTAQGFDGPNGTGQPVDILPTWTMTPSLGTLSGSPGTTVTLAAQSSPVSGSLNATFGGVTGSVNVDVANIAYTQAYNVFSDAGAGGTIGVAQGPGATNLSLNNLTGGSAPGQTHYMHGTYNLVDSGPGAADAFAVWYVSEPNGSRFMQPYSNGYLQFWVRTTKDLQFSLSSSNITPPGSELCKFRLSQLGIPADGNWQQVTLSLDSFHTADNRLDFSQISNYFTVGVLSSQIGTGSGSFDIANVQWLTASTSAIDPNKVYAGLVGKQNPSTGLVLSFDNDASLQAVTYDQALALMNYTYQGDFAVAARVMAAYSTLYTGNGFYDGYNRDTKAVLPAMNSRAPGPNAWMLLAMIHYRNATGQTTYDAMIHGTAAWLLTLQDSADGGIRHGFNGAGAAQLQKSTEENLDCYAAFNAYAQLFGNASYLAAANSIADWLATKAWIPGQNRFNVGLFSDGTPNPDKALDAYSWAPLATSSYTAVLATAQTDFENTKPADVTGFSVDGFDMGGIVGQPATYTDAVWLEGTAQMVSAYWIVKDQTRANHFLNEIEKAIVVTSPSTQGLTYATNGGSGFGGFQMDSLHPAVSSMGWYLFAKNRFNPFHPFMMLTTQVKNISNNAPASLITWSNAVIPSSWIMANQYIELTFQPITSQNTPGGAGSQGSPDSQGNLWQTRILTDNTGPGTGTTNFPKWQDPTPGSPNNLDSNPAGLIDVPGTTSTSRTPLTLAWSVKGSTDTAATGIASGDPASSAQWLTMLDAQTPWIDVNNNGLLDAGDIQAVSTNPSQDPVIVQKGNLMHSAQGPAGYFDSLSPTYIYLEADFGRAVSGPYKTQIYVESFSL